MSKNFYTTKRENIPTLDRLISESSRAGAKLLTLNKIPLDAPTLYNIKLTVDNKDGTYEGIQQVPLAGTISGGSGGRVCDWEDHGDPLKWLLAPDPLKKKEKPLLCEIEGRPTGEGQTVKGWYEPAVIGANGVVINPARWVCILNTDRCKVRVSGSGPDYAGTQLDGSMVWPSPDGIELQEISGREIIFAISSFAGSSNPAHNSYKDFWVTTKWDYIDQRLVSYFEYDDPFIVPADSSIGLQYLKENDTSAENLDVDGRFKFKGAIARAEDLDSYDPAGNEAVQLAYTLAGDDIEISAETAGSRIAADEIWIQAVRAGNLNTLNHIGPSQNDPWIDFKVIDPSFSCDSASFSTVQDAEDWANTLIDSIKTISVDLKGHINKIADCDGGSPETPPPTVGEIYLQSSLISVPAGPPTPEHIL